jgi:hypothetical protein
MEGKTGLKRRPDAWAIASGQDDHNFFRIMIEGVGSNTHMRMTWTSSL